MDFLEKNKTYTCHEHRCVPPLTPGTTTQLQYNQKYQPHLWPSAGPPAPPGTGSARPSAGHWVRGPRGPLVLPPYSTHTELNHIQHMGRGLSHIPTALSILIN